MENFDIPSEAAITLPLVADAPPEVPVKKERKVRKQHITEERKEELKKIRSEALKKGRAAAAAKRKAKKEGVTESSDAMVKTTPTPTPTPAPAPAPAPAPEKIKSKAIIHSMDELVDLKVEKKLLEKERIQMNNDRNKLENEITSLRRQLKEQKEILNKPQESAYASKDTEPPKIEMVVSNVIAKPSEIADPIPKIQKDPKKKFNTKDKKINKKRVFGF